ncbi:hypothetical protein BGAL_0976g00010 [Botrytis galanthina]|uniref:DNA2/NAM7 helicase-like C-terminal domain-containing protein n=1 Tax=Botrytis galanthina TaxID=278940 RepID=A0A4S8QIY6_9HELO|nr:hypothetical protein BGAL_0976g00010 [Botrytis galanthina]
MNSDINKRALFVEENGITEYNTAIWNGDEIDPILPLTPLKKQVLLSKFRFMSSINYVSSTGVKNTIGRHSLEKVASLTRERRPTAQLIIRIPHAGSPYIGFIIRLHRGNTPGLTTGNCRETPCTCSVCCIHRIEFRFTAGSFRLFSRHGIEDECFVTFQNIHHQKPWIVGFPWPFHAAIGENQDWFNKIEELSNAVQWTVGLCYNKPTDMKDDWVSAPIKYCQTAALMFATSGNAQNQSSFDAFLMPKTKLAYTHWSPLINAKFDPESDQLGPHLDKYQRMINFETWEEYCIANAYGLISDTRWSVKYLGFLRYRQFMTQFITVPEKENTLLAVLIMTETSDNTHKILDLGDEVELMTYPFIPGFDENGKTLQDGDGWKATVINSNQIEHGGTHLLKLKLHPAYFSHRQSYDKYNPKGKFYPIYIKVFNSLNPTRYQLKALSAMHPEANRAAIQRRTRVCDGDSINDPRSATSLTQHYHFDDENGVYFLDDDSPNNEERKVATWKNETIDYSTNRSILMGNSIVDMWYWDLLKDCPPDKLELILTNCTPKQRADIQAFGNRIPCDLLIIKGPPGSGKTVGLVTTIEIVLCSGKKVLAAAAQNTAVNNLFDRTVNSIANLNLNQDILSIRLWSENIEYDKMINLNVDQLESNSLKTSQGFSGQSFEYSFKNSLAGRVWAVAGFIASENPIISRLRANNPTLHEILAIKPLDRTEEQNKSARQLVRSVSRALILQAQFIACTFTQCESDWGLLAQNTTDVCVADEVAAATELQLLQLWKGSRKPFICGGDDAQLPAFIATEYVKNKDKKPICLFVDQMRFPFITRMAQLGWPFWAMSQQLRMCPGMFDMANAVYFKNAYQHGDQVLEDFPLAIVFERWSLTLSDIIEPSPAGKVWPIFIQCNNTFSHCEIGGTSRRNTQTAEICLRMILSLIAFDDQVHQEDFIIVVPYLAQRQLYIAAKNKNKYFAGIEIATSSAYQGFEKHFVFYDMTAASNMPNIGIVAESKRNTMATTRQKSALVILGDDTCLDGKSHHEVKEEVTVDEAEDHLINPKAEGNEIALYVEPEWNVKSGHLKLMFTWFTDRQRVIHHEAKDLHPPFYIDPQIFKDDMGTLAMSETLNS